MPLRHLPGAGCVAVLETVAGVKMRLLAGAHLFKLFGALLEPPLIYRLDVEAPITADFETG